MKAWIDFGVPVLTALTSGVITYLVAIKTQNTKLEETKLTLEQEISTLEKSHEFKLQELEKEVEMQNKAKENDVMLSVMGKFMETVLENPEKMKDLQKIAMMTNMMPKDTK